MPILPEFSLSNKIAVLATSGGDQAPVLAQALGEAGATIFAIARRQPSLDATLAALAGSPGKHAGVVAEVGSPTGVTDAFQVFQRRHDRVDILVNDARSYFAKPFSQVTVDEWDTVQFRNVRANFLLCQEVGRRMLERKYGRIVNVISGLAERGMANGTAFSASQAAVLSLTRSLAVEWGQHNVRVNAIGTGWSTTDDIPLEVQQQELLVRYIPLRLKGHPRDLGPLLVYLCSEACDYTTGQPVYVDGGLMARP